VASAAPVHGALAAILTKAIDPSRHSVFDGVAVYRVVSEAARLVEEVALTPDEARVWLDAVALLRARGARVTAAMLLVAMVAPADGGSGA
jgi:hypothetical protein